jgi:hypothetical protein
MHLRIPASVVACSSYAADHIALRTTGEEPRTQERSMFEMDDDLR